MTEQTNINPNIVDPHYRYKMPKIIITTPKNKSKKTNLHNLYQISTSINRDEKILSKYISTELNTNNKITRNNDVKNSDLDSNTFILTLNGTFSAKQIQSVIFKFIEKYVLCDKCSNPETVYKYKPKDDIFERFCLACGFIENIKGEKGSDQVIKNLLKNKEKYVDEKYSKKFESKNNYSEDENLDQSVSSNENVEINEASGHIEFDIKSLDGLNTDDEKLSYLLKNFKGLKIILKDILEKKVIKKSVMFRFCLKNLDSFENLSEKEKKDILEIFQ